MICWYHASMRLPMYRANADAMGLPSMELTAQTACASMVFVQRPQRRHLVRAIMVAGVQHRASGLDFCATCAIP